MIPQQIPVTNYYGNNQATLFSFHFLIENENQIMVTHTDLEGKETVLKYGIDYELHYEYPDEQGRTSYDASNFGGKITFPIEGSEYSVLQWDEKTNTREVLSIALTLPIEQPSEYNDSSELNLENLEYSFDYLTRICQILSRELELTMKVAEGSGDNMSLRLPQPKANNVFKWNEEATAIENYDILAEYDKFKTETKQEFQEQENEFQAIVNEQIQGLDSRVEKAEQDATIALGNTTDAEGHTAIQVALDSEARSLNAQEVATNASNVSEEAITTAISANTKSDSAISTSNTADEKSNQAITTSNSAITTATNASNKVDEFGEDIEVVIEAAGKIQQIEGAVAEAKEAASSATTAAGNAVTAAGQATKAAEDAIAALDSKQDKITDIDTIRSNAQAGKSASNTISTYGDIVTHNAIEFALKSEIPDISKYALDSGVVHKAQNETITGVKTFNGGSGGNNVGIKVLNGMSIGSTTQTAYAQYATIRNVNGKVATGSYYIDGNSSVLFRHKTGTATAEGTANDAMFTINPETGIKAGWSGTVGVGITDNDLHDVLIDTIEYSKLNTTAKDVLGAINEVKSSIPSLVGYATENFVTSQGYITSSYHDNTKQDKLTSGSNIKTINGESVLGSGDILLVVVLVLMILLHQLQLFIHQVRLRVTLLNLMNLTTLTHC